MSDIRRCCILGCKNHTTNPSCRCNKHLYSTGYECNSNLLVTIVGICMGCLVIVMTFVAICALLSLFGCGSTCPTIKVSDGPIPTKYIPIGNIKLVPMGYDSFGISIKISPTPGFDWKFIP